MSSDDTPTLVLKEFRGIGTVGAGQVYFEFHTGSKPVRVMMPTEQAALMAWALFKAGPEAPLRDRLFVEPLRVSHMAGAAVPAGLLLQMATSNGYAFSFTLDPAQVKRLADIPAKLHAKQDTPKH